MKTSKTLFRNAIKILEAAGMTHNDIAKELGYKSSNFVGMCGNPRDGALPSLNWIKKLKMLCGMTDAQAMRLVMARVQDSDGRPISINPNTFAFVLNTYAEIRIAQHELKMARK